MKKLFMVGLIIISAQAGGIWDMVKNVSSDGNLKTKQYTLEVSGTNTRLYVTYIKEMNSFCAITYSSKGIPAIACKTKKEIGMSN